MAIDTAAKRRSAIATRRLPWMRRFMPRPDGSVDQADRQQVAFVYRGILAGAIVDASIYSSTLYLSKAAPAPLRLDRSPPATLKLSE